MSMRRVVSVLLCLAGCGRTGVDAAHTGPTASELAAAPLVARFEAHDVSFASSNEATLAFIVENHSAQPVQLDLDVLGSAILGLEVVNSDGAPVRTIPPGLPPRDYQPRSETLAPGASRRFVQELNVFMPPLPAGRYTARVRWAPLHSETVHFEID